ncbi:hypothetical protein OpiT1DRAFT_04748 [Opitutaceae bacterium TAV1]|nr:hypothetical protein OpiT1DRAFT_04748 [Opitutaceae bacterium TAV1]
MGVFGGGNSKQTQKYVDGSANAGAENADALSVGEKGRGANTTSGLALATGDKSQGATSLLGDAYSIRGNNNSFTSYDISGEVVARGLDTVDLAIASNSLNTQRALDAGMFGLATGAAVAGSAMEYNAAVAGTAIEQSSLFGQAALESGARTANAALAGMNTAYGRALDTVDDTNSNLFGIASQAIESANTFAIRASDAQNTANNTAAAQARAAFDFAAEAAKSPDERLTKYALEAVAAIIIAATFFTRKK